MTHPFPIILLSLASTLPLMAQQPSQVSPPAVRPNGNALDVRFGGKTRLAAGGPRFQSGTPVFTEVTDGGGVFSFHADADSVEGSFRPSDVHGIRGDKFAIVDHFSGAMRYAGREDVIPVSLGRLGCRLYYVIPLIDGMGAVGLIEKYNAPATLLHSSVRGGVISAVLYEGGKFAAVGPRAPHSVNVNGTDVPFTYSGGLIIVQIPPGGEAGKTNVQIRF